MIRSARSTLMQQGDLAAGVLDPQGRVIALDEHLPLMAYSLAPSLRSLLEFFGDDVHDGDVFLHNDVWHGNIQHADAGVFVPVFEQHRLVAWVACRGHWSDIGGGVAGTANPQATEVWQEALRIPPLRIVAGGRVIGDVWNMVFSNIRFRDRVEGDAHALIGACRLGAAAITQLVQRCGGPDGFARLTAGLFDATARSARTALTLLPQGRLVGGVSYIDDSVDGVTAFPIKVAVEIGPDGLVIDFTGTVAQTDTMMNAPYASTAAAVLVTVLTLLGPEVAHNEGVLALLTVHAPEGSMLNANFPAATFGGNKLCEYIGAAIMNAFAPAAPSLVCAEWSRRLSLRATGRDPRDGRGFMEMFFLTYGGGGAAEGADGYDQPGLMSGGNVVHQDYELMELQSPLIVWRHEYLPDSAGDGQWRGGMGNDTMIEFYGDDTVFSTHGGGTTFGAAGQFGGGDGAVNLLEVTQADGRTVSVHARQKLGPLVPPVLLRQRTGGGGGFGPASARDAAMRSRDVLAGLASA